VRTRGDKVAFMITIPNERASFPIAKEKTGLALTNSMIEDKSSSLDCVK
jgi:hypothetical protein